jgi:hypothetical protein
MIDCNDQPLVVVVVFAVLVVVGAVVVVATVVVVDVMAAANMASTVVVVGAEGVTPVGSKAIVTRRSLTNLTLAGFVVIVGFFWANVVQ